MRDTTVRFTYRQALGGGVRWTQPSRHRLRAETLLRTRDHPGAAAVGGDRNLMSVDISCPSCGYDDCVQSVPAIRASGTSTVYGADYYSGVGVSSLGLVPVMGSSLVERTQSSYLAQSLAPEPGFRGAGRLTTLAVVLSLPAVGYFAAGAVLISRPQPDVSAASIVMGTFGFALFLALPSLLILWFAFRRLRRSARIRRGAPAAYAVWRAGVYCHRCGMCFWPFAPAAGIPVRHPVPPGGFQGIVWNAGGYLNDA